MFLAAAVLSAAVLQWWQSFRGSERIRQDRFDPVAWKEADHKKPDADHRTVRSHMIDDLLRRYKFDGWTRQQVIDLLGQPTGPGEESGFPQFDVIYVLGLERGGAFALDDEALGFSFDATDRVEKCGLSVN